MQREVLVGLVGDRSPSVVAHEAIPVALERAAQALDIGVGYRWIPTDEIESVARVAEFDGLWCVPGGPYRSMDGALLAIRYARETRTPFLGTCAGFQHAVIEYARNVLGWNDAAHAESSPDAARAVIAPLACGLLDDEGSVRLRSGTRIAAAYGVPEANEEYLCRYGLNPAFRAALVAGPLRVAAEDQSGDVRAVELDGHPFFVATLFQPERAALKGRSAPLVVAFAGACAAEVLPCRALPGAS
jgi:CTP synthase (UTP-ammonia lyase)